MDTNRTPSATTIAAGTATVLIAIALGVAIVLAIVAVAPARGAVVDASPAIEYAEFRAEVDAIYDDLRTIFASRDFVVSRQQTRALAGLERLEAHVPHPCYVVTWLVERDALRLFVEYLALDTPDLIGRAALTLHNVHRETARTLPVNCGNASG